MQVRTEMKASTLGRPIERVIFPVGVYRKDCDDNDVIYEALRWQKLRNADPNRMLLLMSKFVFPFLPVMTGGRDP